jgi:hypothetical protein
VTKSKNWLAQQNFCQYVHVRLETCQDFISFESEGGSCVHNQPQ